jgi:hypothetical protein
MGMGSEHKGPIVRLDLDDERPGFKEVEVAPRGATIRFYLGDGRRIECHLDEDGLFVRTPDGRLTVRPRCANEVRVDVVEL